MRTLLFFFFISLTTVSRGQDSERPVPYEKPVFHDLRPIRSTEHGWKTLNDITEHLPPDEVSQYDSLITFAHENLHGLDFEIINRYRYRNSHCYYVGDDKFVVLPKTRLTLQGLRARIPGNIEQDTRDIFYTYFGNTTWDNAEYILEEWNAYCMGCVMRAEQPLAAREYESEVLFMNMFNVYAIYMASEEDSPEIINFVKWMTARTKRLTWENRPTRDTDRYLVKVRTGAGYAECRRKAIKAFGKDWSRVYLEFRE